jgi:integrase/recombinase XerC
MSNNMPELANIDFVLSETDVDDAPWLSRKNNPYLNFMARLKPASRNTMRFCLQQVASIMGADDIPLEEIMWHKLERSHLLAMVAKMNDTGYAHKTCALYLTAIRGVINEAHYANLIPSFQVAGIRSVKPYEQNRLPVGKFVEDPILKALLEDCNQDTRYQGVRDAAIISLLYGCGLRRAESVAVDIAKINQQEWSLTVIGKGDKEMKKWIAPGAATRMKAWIELRNRFCDNEGPLFTRIRKGRKVRSALDDLDPMKPGYTPGGITSSGLTPMAIYYILKERSQHLGFHVKPHDLRRTFVTRMIEKHGEGMAKMLADHSNLATTLKYDMRGDKQKQAAMQDENF